MHKRLYVYVTECSANKSGSLMKKNLDDIGIPCQVVLDASVGYVLEKVDLVPIFLTMHCDQTFWPTITQKVFVEGHASISFIWHPWI